MKKQVIHVNREMSEYIESLQYDLEALSELLIRGASVEGTEAHKFWLDKYLGKKKEYNVAKAELARLYVKPHLKEDEKCSWSLDYATHELVIESVEE